MIFIALFLHLTTQLVAAMSFPELLVVALPLLTTFLSGWLSHNGLPAWTNATISGVVVLLSAFLWALLGGKLAGDLVVDTVLIAGYCAALMAGPLAPLHQWLIVKLVSPFEIFAPTPLAVPVVAVSSPAPASPIPPRASALVSERSWSLADIPEDPGSTKPVQAMPLNIPSKPLPPLTPQPAEPPQTPDEPRG